MDDEEEKKFEPAESAEPAAAAVEGDDKIAAGFGSLLSLSASAVGKG